MRKKLWLIRIIIVFLFAFGLYYVSLPALNIHNPAFYIYLFMVLACYVISSVLMLADGGKVINKLRDLPKNLLIIIGGVSSVFIIIVLTNVICSPLFNSKSWANRIAVMEDTNFTDDISEVDFNKVPLLDKDSRRRF